MGQAMAPWDAFRFIGVFAALSAGLWWALFMTLIVLQLNISFPEDDK
jgi:hypothetical protein